MLELNIQINNPTVFLAQERVTAFTKVTPQELLAKTELAVDPKLAEYRKDITILQDTESKTVNDLQEKEKLLKEKSEQRDRLQVEVNKMEELKKKEQLLEVLEKRIHWIRYENSKINSDEKKKEKIKADNAEREEVAKCDPIRERTKQAESGYREAVKADELLKDELKQIVNSLDKISSSLEAGLKVSEEKKDKIDEFEDELKSVAKRRVALERELNLIEEKFAKFPEDAKLKEELNAFEREKAKLIEIREIHNEEVENLQTALRLKKRKIDENKRKLEDLGNARKRGLQNIVSIDRKYSWIQHMCEWIDRKTEEKVFQQPVYGPICLEVNSNHPHFFEANVSLSAKMAFVVQNKHDANMLSAEKNRVASGGGMRWLCTIYEVLGEAPRQVSRIGINVHTNSIHTNIHACNHNI